MKLFSVGIVGTVCCFAGLSAKARSATTFYVDAAAGSDAAAGTSAVAAWKTLKTVNQAAFVPGDQVLFKRGGIWRGQLVPHSGDEHARVYYGAYGQGPKPILEQSVSRGKPSDWTEIQPGLWSTCPYRPTLVKKVAGDFAGMKWSGSFQGGAQGDCGRMTEGGFSFNRLTYVGGARESQQVQLWGPAFHVVPPCLVLRMRVRATHPFSLRSIRLLEPHAPWTTVAAGDVVGFPVTIDSEWKTLEYRLVRASTVEGARLHLSIGGAIPENTVFDFSPVEIWEASVPPDNGLPFDIGIVILNHGEKWGVKKWALADLKQPLDYWYDRVEQRVVVKSDRNPAAAFTSVELAQTQHVIEQGGRHDVTYENLAVRYTGSHGFGGGNTKNITIRACDIYWIGGGLQFFQPNGRPVRFGNGIEFWANARGNVVEKCRLWEIYDAALTNQGDTDHPGGSDAFDITYRDNVIWNAEYSFECWNRPEFSKMHRITFEHNTCVDAGFGWAHGQRPDPNGAHLMFYINAAETKGFIVRDNLFCNTTEYNTRMMSDWRSGLTMDHNLYYLPDKPIIWWLSQKKYPSSDFAAYQRELQMDLHSLYAKPEFMDAEHHDYRLKPGTPGTSLASDGGPVGARP